MSNIIFNDPSWVYPNGTNLIGYNDTVALWGNDAGDLLTFADTAAALQVAGNTSWVINGNGASATGGAETISFASVTSGIVFNDMD